MKCGFDVTAPELDRLKHLITTVLCTHLLKIKLETSKCKYISSTRPRANSDEDRVK